VSDLADRQVIGGSTIVGETRVAGDVVAGNKITSINLAAPALPCLLSSDDPCFRGRRRALQRLDAFLDDSENDLAPLVIVIQGMAGVGKTALSVRWAHTIAPQFPDGQLFVDLRGHSSSAEMTAEEALDRMLRALGVPGELIPSEVDAQAALYRSYLAERRMLVILDNATSSSRVKHLLPAGSRCVTIITSRNRLPGLIVSSGVRTLDLDVLRPDEAYEVVAALIGREIASAQRTAVVELTRQCAFLPLALRIAGANQRVRPHDTVADVVRELADGNRLSASTLDEDPEQSALRTAFTLSYRDLNDEQRRGFCMLGLIEASDFGVAAAEALLDRDRISTQRILRGLTLASLVDEIGARRYRLHDLLRDYAREHLASDELTAERTAGQERLLGWLLDTSQRAARAINPHRCLPVDAPTHGLEEALAWFEEERGFLIAAARQTFSIGRYEMTWRLADALSDFLDLRTYTQDNLEAHLMGREAADIIGDDLALAGMLRHLAAIHREQCDYARAIRAGERARKLFRQYRDRWAESEAIATLASIYWKCSSYGQFRALIHAARAIRQDIGDRIGEAECLDDLARIERRLGHCAAAICYDLEALDIRQELGDLRGEAKSFQNLSRVYCRMGIHDWALHAAQRALAISQQLGDQRSKAAALCSMANIFRHTNRPREAVTAAQEALLVQQRIGDSRGETITRDNLARICLSLGETEAAMANVTRALAIDEGLSDPYGTAQRLHTLGLINIYCRDTEAGQRNFEAELSLRQRIGDVRGTTTTYIAMAELYKIAGQHATAIDDSRKAVAIERCYNNPFALGRRLRTAGLIASQVLGPAAACQYWIEARALLKDFDEQAARELDDLLDKFALHSQALGGNGSCVSHALFPLLCQRFDESHILTFARSVGTNTLNSASRSRNLHDRPTQRIGWGMGRMASTVKSFLWECRGGT
jgi:tetratricopeptide (TPR) repeat protein